MGRFVVRIVHAPAHRFKVLFDLVSFGLSVTFVIIGAGFAVGGTNSVVTPHQLGLINWLEAPIGGLHAHGFILMFLGLTLSYGAGEFRRSSRIALQGVAFYSLVSAILIFFGWAFYKIDFSAPWWYVFTSFLSIALLILAPPLNDRGRVHQGSRSERA